MKRSNAKIRESANKDRWPPLNSDNDCFQTPPNATLTSRPSKKLQPSGGSNLAVVPGSNVEKMEPKSLQDQIRCSVHSFEWRTMGENRHECQNKMAHDLHKITC